MHHGVQCEQQSQTTDKCTYTHRQKYKHTQTGVQTHTRTSDDNTIRSSSSSRRSSIVGFRVFGAAACAVSHVLAMEEHVNLSEGRSCGLVAVPALPDQIVDLRRTDGRPRGTQRLTVGAVEVIEIGDDLFVR